MRSPSAVECFTSDLAARFPHVHILINNAAQTIAKYDNHLKFHVLSYSKLYSHLQMEFLLVPVISIVRSTYSERS